MSIGSENLTDEIVEEIEDVQTEVELLTQEMAQRSTPKIAVGAESTTTYSSIIDITDKGVLTGILSQITHYTADSIVDVKITIDGIAFISGALYFSFVAVGNSWSMPFNHIFNTSLKIEHKIIANSKGTARTTVSYTID